jgi:TrmH family RNA methyltransferase
MPSKAVQKAVAALRDAAERERTGLVLVEGPRLAAEALRRGVLHELYLDPSARETAALAAEAARRGVPVTAAAPFELERMAEVKTPAGAIGVARRNAPIAAADLLREHAALVYFEGVQDPGNVGTIARTAEAFGHRALLFGPGSADPTAPKTLRSSAGSLLDAPYAVDLDVPALLALAAASGHVVVLADVRAGTPHRALRPPPRRILAVANEGAGTRVPADAPGVLRTTIALERDVESLNVGVAAAILLDRLRDEGAPLTSPRA